MDINDKIWNPWHGCHRYSEGCQNCYAYFLDKRYGRDTNEVVKNKSDFNLPVKKDKNGNWKLPSGSYVRVCMASDFFLEEADEWRDEAWSFIRRRPDVTFSLLTKRANRIKDCLPSDWGDGWENVAFSVSCENQKRLEERMPYLLDVPAKHRWVSLKPFIGEVDIEPYLATGKIETVLAGGENYLGSRPLRYEWVKKVRDACEKNDVQLIFGQTGNVFVVDGVEHKIRNRTDQMVHALRSGLYYPPVNVEERVAEIYERKAAMKEAMAKGRKPKESDKFHC